jgi:uncharacterized membrane protein
MSAHALAISATAFLASVVELVEALTIVRWARSYIGRSRAFRRT